MTTDKVVKVLSCLSIDLSFRIGQIFTIDSFDNLCRNTTNNRMRWNILCSHCTRSNHCPFTDVHTISNNRPCSNPNIIIDGNPLSCNPLLNKWELRIRKYMVDGNYLAEWGSIDTVTDYYATLPANNRVLPDQAVLPDFNPC